MKPWLIQFNSQSKTAYTPTDYAHASDLIQLWWNIFCDNVHQKLTEQMNFWPAIIPYTQDCQYLSNQSKNYYHELYMQQKDYLFHIQQQQQEQDQEKVSQFQDHHNHQHHHHEQMSIYEYDFANIKDYQDPWEDYYENLNIEHNDNNSDRTEQVQQYNEDVVHEEHKQQHEEYAEHIEYNAYQEHVETNEAVIEFCIDLTNEFESNRDIIIEQVQTVEPANSGHVSEAPCTPCPIVEAVILEPTHTNHEQSTNVEPKNAFIENSQLVVEATETLDTQSVAHAENGTVQNEAGLAGALSQLRLGEASTPEQDAYEQLMRRQCWESGKIDYSGKDSFDNIWKKITQTLETKPSKEDDKSEGLSLESINQLLTEADLEHRSAAASIQRLATEKTPIETGGLSLARINQLLIEPPEAPEDQVVVQRITVSQIQPQQLQHQHQQSSSLRSRQKALRKFK